MYRLVKILTIIASVYVVKTLLQRVLSLKSIEMKFMPVSTVFTGIEGMTAGLLMTLIQMVSISRSTIG